MKTNYENTRMLDMIFEGRNKSYGAYALRTNYNSRISHALLITLTSIFLLGFGKFIADKMKSGSTELSGHIVVVEPIEEVHFEKPEIKIEPPRPPQIQEAQALATVRDPEIRVTNDNHVNTDSLPTPEQLEHADPGLTSNPTGNPIGVDGGHGTAQTFMEAPHVTEPSNEPLAFAEVMPEFPGGEKKLREFLSDKTNFPDMERNIDMEGKALVKFVVNEDGSISNVKVLKSDSPGFGREAVRVVGLMPKFIPGSQQGKNVKVQFVLPFQFKLRP